MTSLMESAADCKEEVTEEAASTASCVRLSRVEGGGELGGEGEEEDEEEEFIFV